MNALLPMLAIAAVIGVLTIARLRATSSGLRARRQFLHDRTPALEVMGDLQFGLYVKQLLRERGYCNVTVVGGVSESVKVLATSPADKPAVFQCLPQCTSVSDRLIEEIVASVKGDGKERDGYVVTASLIDRESVDIATRRGIVIVDRPIIDRWISQARGAVLVDLLETEKPILTISKARIVIPCDVLLLVQSGRKIEAIKLYRQLNPSTRLKDAEQVILWLSGMSDSSAMFADAVCGCLELSGGGSTDEIASLARQGMRIQAIKRYRQLNPGVKLRDAKSFVNRIH